MHIPCKTESDCLKAFHALFDHVPWTVSISDINQPDQPTIYVNPAFTALTGYHAADIVGKNCRILQGQDRHQPDAVLLKNAITNKQFSRAKLKNYRKDGTHFWNLIRIVPIRTDNHRLNYVLGLQLDISWAMSEMQHNRDLKQG